MVVIWVLMLLFIILMLMTRMMVMTIIIIISLTDYGDIHHLSDSSGPVEGRVSQTSLVEGAISVALLPG